MDLKQVALLMSLSLLGACNVAMSDKPLFGEAQRSSALGAGRWHLDARQARMRCRPRQAPQGLADLRRLGDRRWEQGAPGIRFQAGRWPGGYPHRRRQAAAAPGEGDHQRVASELGIFGVPSPSRFEDGPDHGGGGLGGRLRHSRSPEAGRVPRSVPIRGSAKSAARPRSMHCARPRARSAPPIPKP